MEKIQKAIEKGEDWRQVKTNLPLFAIGAIEWYGSFSNGGFPRGYAKSSATRNYYQEAYRNHKKQAENPNYLNIIFAQSDYFDIPNNLPQYWRQEPNYLFYCDSPYRGVKSYGISPHFDFDKYYQWLQDTSKLYPIFVSEQLLPENFDKFLIWAKDAKRTVGLNNNFAACEKLYLIDNRD